MIIRSFMLALALGAACRAATYSGRALEKVAIGASPVLTGAGVFIAKEKGFFSDQGIDAAIKIFASSTRDILPLLATSRIDVGFGGVSAGLFNAIGEGVGMKLVADKGHTPAQRGYRSVVISKKLFPGTLSKENIRGKSFALSMKGYGSEIVLERFLKGYGLEFKDVEIVTLPYPSINAALLNGSVFGAEQIEPFLAIAKRDGFAVEVAASAQLYPYQQGGCVMFSQSFMRDRPEIAKRFMVAYLQGLRYYNDYLRRKAPAQEVFDIMKKYTSIDDPKLFALIQSPGLNPDGYLDLKSLKYDLHWYHQKGYLERALPLTDIVDHRFVDAALQVLGKYKP